MLLCSDVQEDDATAFAEAQRQEAERHRAQWEQDLVDKARLAHMVPDRAAFAQQVGRQT